MHKVITLLCFYVYGLIPVDYTHTYHLELFQWEQRDRERCPCANEATCNDMGE